MEISILFRDDELVVVNKPSGLMVHRSLLAKDVNEFALQIVRDQIGEKVYPVHRLDRATSGALIFALSSKSARSLSQQFAAGEVEKRYLAVVRGVPPNEFTVDHSLKEELDEKIDRGAKADKPAQSARTCFSTLATTEFAVSVDKYPTSRYSLVLAEPKTGRKHQIRRHLHHCGHPIIGDVAHGSGKHNRFFRQKFGIHRLLLACMEISFSHPVDGRIIRIQAPLAEEYLKLLNELGWGAVSIFLEK